MTDTITDEGRIEYPDCPHADGYEHDGPSIGLVCKCPDKHGVTFNFCNTANALPNIGCPIRWKQIRDDTIPTRYSLQPTIEKNEMQKLPAIIYGVVQEED